MAKKLKQQTLFDLDKMNDNSGSLLEKILQEEREKEKIEPVPGDSEELKKHREAYYDAKIVVKRLERTNSRTIYIFPAFRNEDGNWYRVAGNSALLYKYFLCPRIGRTVEYLDDPDLSCRFKYGMISIHGLDSLKKKIKPINYEITELGKFGIVKIDLKQDFSAEEIRNYADLRRDDEQRIKRVIEPKESFPDLYARLRQMVGAGGSMMKFTRIKKEFTDTLGARMINAVIDLFDLYFQIANGKIEKKTGGEEMLRKVDFLFAGLAILDEMRTFDVPARAKIGSEITEVKAAIKRNIFKEKDE